MATPFQEAMRRRLMAIDDQGNAQTTWQTIAAQREAQAKRDQEAYNWQRSYIDRINMINQTQRDIAGGQGFSYAPNDPRRFELSSSGNPFDKFVNQIASKESGGNYGAMNRSSGAMGKYQIMPSNIQGTGRGWDYEALGRDISTAQFMKSPQIQEQIARYKLQQYYNKYGPAGASIAWYAGPNAAKNYANSGYASTRGESGGYPSVSSYMNSIMGGL